MANFEMLKHNSICICDYVAAISKRDPQKCWACQSAIDYNDFERLRESTGEPITTLEAERTRKGKEVEFKNPEGNADNINNNLTSDIEEFPDDLTLGEFLQKLRALKVNKNKEKQNALEVEEARLAVAKPSPAGSYGGLGGLKLPGSVSRMHEPVVGAGAHKGKQKAFEVEEPSPAGSYGRLGGLKPWINDGLVCSISKNPAEFNTQIAKRFMRRI